MIPLWVVAVISVSWAIVGFWLGVLVTLTPCS